MAWRKRELLAAASSSDAPSELKCFTRSAHSSGLCHDVTKSVRMDIAFKDGAFFFGSAAFGIAIGWRPSLNEVLFILLFQLLSKVSSLNIVD